MEDTITLTVDEMNRILAYLAKRPYEEVYTLINMVQNEYEKQNAKNKENQIETIN